jgi:hypothetical protein
MTGGKKKRYTANEWREIEKYLLEFARDRLAASLAAGAGASLPAEIKARAKKRRGRPRSVPAKGRATSNAWRDKRKREAYTKARIVFDRLKQTELEAARRGYKELKKEWDAELWAEMDRMCKAPPKD